MKKTYEYIDAYSDVISYLSTGARTAEELLGYIVERSALSKKEAQDISADGRYSRLRAGLGAMLQQMLGKKIIAMRSDGRYYAKADVPIALRAEKCEHEILRLLSAGPLSKDKIRAALTDYFGTKKTKTRRDDNMLNTFIIDTLKQLTKEGVIAFDGSTVGDMEDLQGYLEYYEMGESVEVTIMRADGGNYKEQTLTIVLGEAVKTEPTGRR